MGNTIKTQLIFEHEKHWKLEQECDTKEYTWTKILKDGTSIKLPVTVKITNTTVFRHFEGGDIIVHESTFLYPIFTVYKVVKTFNVTKFYIESISENDSIIGYRRVGSSTQCFFTRYDIEYIDGIHGFTKTIYLTNKSL